MVVKLREHQQTAVDNLSNGKILWGGVGSGKTITSIAYFYTKVCGGVVGDFGSLRTPADLYVVTTAKKRDSLDWQIEAARFGITEDREESVGQTTITVDSWNNIAKYEGVKNAFFIFDEQRLVGSGAWTKSFLKIAKNNRWILLSATPGDTWLDYIPVFLANGFYKTRTEFKREHVIYSYYGRYPKVERYVGVGKLIKLKNKLLVEMPYEAHTTRHIHDVCVDYDVDLFRTVVKKRWNYIEDRPIKDAGEMFRLMRRVVNGDHSRIQAVRSLMQKHPKLIIFYNFDYELEMLRTLSSSFQESLNETTCGGGSRSPSFEVAEWNGHKHQPIPDTDRWVYLVQYAAGSEGWNCVDTDAMVFYSLTYSYKNWHQAFGRIDRLNTSFTDLHYYILKSDALIDQLISKSLRSKKNFNESEYGRYIT